MNIDELALISNTAHQTTIRDSGSIEIKTVRSASWLKNQRINFEALKPAAMIQGKLYVYETRPTKA